MHSDGSTYTSTHEDSVLAGYIKYRTATNCAPHLLSVLNASDSVLDVGCGPGSISLDLAPHVALGHVTGVDNSPIAIQKATELAKTMHASNCTFLTADIYHLPFPDASFDKVHVHQVLQHVSNPVDAVVELKRVLKPGGMLAATESDLGGSIWHPDIPGLTLWKDIYPKVQKANGGDAFAGRMLLSLYLSPRMTLCRQAALMAHPRRLP